MARSGRSALEAYQRDRSSSLNAQAPQSDPGRGCARNSPRQIRAGGLQRGRGADSRPPREVGTVRPEAGRSPAPASLLVVAGNQIRQLEDSPGCATTCCRETGSTFVHGHARDPPVQRGAHLGVVVGGGGHRAGNLDVQTGWAPATPSPFAPKAPGPGPRSTGRGRCATAPTRRRSTGGFPHVGLRGFRSSLRAAGPPE